MIQSPIHKALLTFLSCDVRFLLMGGQACILYGGAEFSRDLDLTIATDNPNLDTVRKALSVLDAEEVFVPSLSPHVLDRGHACHFRCRAKGAEGLRIDLMARMRGCDSFDALWERRSIVHLPQIGEVGVLSLPDLVAAKKTQREKDWPMIRRLIETDIQTTDSPDEQRVVFWLREGRTPEALIAVTEAYPGIARAQLSARPLLSHALRKSSDQLADELAQEESAEKQADRLHWAPLRKELEEWRRTRK